MTPTLTDTARPLSLPQSARDAVLDSILSKRQSSSPAAAAVRAYKADKDADRRVVAFHSHDDGSVTAVTARGTWHEITIRTRGGRQVVTGCDCMDRRHRGLTKDCYHMEDAQKALDQAAGIFKAAHPSAQVLRALPLDPCVTCRQFTIEVRAHGHYEGMTKTFSGCYGWFTVCGCGVRWEGRK